MPAADAERAKAATGRRAGGPAARRALEQSRREERQGEARRFKTAKDAIAHLKRL